MKAVFLKEWSKIQHIIVEKAIKKYLNSRYFENSHGYFENLFEALGLAYTSSSSYAGLWICNVELYLDANKKYKIIGFALDTNTFVHAICWDNEENEIIIPIN